MNRKEYPRMGETVFSARLENGLTVYVDVKPDFQKSYAFFATDYGGMDMKFQLDGQWHDTPAGVAHFLEHKTFDTKDGNALQDLAANGASPNAFTSSAITGYYFESTEKFYENLKILLSFVSQPYYTQESVDKEQGIIGQEIRMIEDDPENQVYYAMLEGLYAHHPIRTSVAGDHRVHLPHHGGYPEPVPQRLLQPGQHGALRGGQRGPGEGAGDGPGDPAQRGQGLHPRDYGPAEPQAAARSRTELKMEVSTSIFQLGWKMDPAPRGEEQFRQKLVAELSCEALLGNSSPLYVRLYREGLLNSSFTYGFDGYPSCAYAMAGGESTDPDALAAAIAAEAERIGREGVDPALFARLKKGMYGTKVRGLNSFENICVGMAQAYFAGYDMLRFPEVFENISQADVEACIRTCFTPERAALAVVMPGEGQA